MTMQSKIVDVSPLLALMTAVDCHPVESVRQSAKRAVEASVGDLIIKESQRAIETLLSPFADHPIEPLVLTPTDLWMIAVIQADASERRQVSNPTLRIVGRDTFGSSGGVCLHGFIRAEQLRRTDCKSQATTHSSAAIVFNNLRQWAERASVASAVHVTKRDTTHGLELLVDTNVLRITEVVEARIHGNSRSGSVSLQSSPPKKLSEVEQVILSQLQRDSRIVPSGILLARLGLRVEHRSDHVALCSGSPESMMRITAALQTPGVLVLQSTRIIGVMLLGKGEDNVMCFRCHDSIQPDWTTALLASDPMIDDRLKYDIAHWCGPHSSWVTTDFLENIATNFEKSHD